MWLGISRFSALGRYVYHIYIKTVGNLLSCNLLSKYCLLQLPKRSQIVEGFHYMCHNAPIKHHDCDIMCSCVLIASRQDDSFEHLYPGVLRILSVLSYQALLLYYLDSLYNNETVTELVTNVDGRQSGGSSDIGVTL